MDEETVSPMKKLTKLVTNTSFQLFDSFVNDTEEKAENVRLQGEFILELQKAAAQNSLVILQVRENPLSNKYETFSGWVATKTVEHDRDDDSLAKPRATNPNRPNRTNRKNH